jgi:hypothetical protein
MARILYFINTCSIFLMPSWQNSHSIKKNQKNPYWRVEPVLWAKNSPFGEMMWSCKCFPYVSKMLWYYVYHIDCTYLVFCCLFIHIWFIFHDLLIFVTLFKVYQWVIFIVSEFNLILSFIFFVFYDCGDVFWNKLYTIVFKMK